jgi:hypothetical protein
VFYYLLVVLIFVKLVYLPYIAASYGYGYPGTSPRAQGGRGRGGGRGGGCPAGDREREKRRVRAPVTYPPPPASRARRRDQAEGSAETRGGPPPPPKPGTPPPPDPPSPPIPRTQPPPHPTPPPAAASSASQSPVNEGDDRAETASGARHRRLLCGPRRGGVPETVGHRGFAGTGVRDAGGQFTPRTPTGESKQHATFGVLPPTPPSDGPPTRAVRPLRAGAPPRPPARPSDSTVPMPAVSEIRGRQHPPWNAACVSHRWKVENACLQSPCGGKDATLPPSVTTSSRPRHARSRSAALRGEGVHNRNDTGEHKDRRLLPPSPARGLP